MVQFSVKNERLHAFRVLENLLPYNRDRDDRCIQTSLVANEIPIQVQNYYMALYHEGNSLAYTMHIKLSKMQTLKFFFW